MNNPNPTPTPAHAPVIDLKSKLSPNPDRNRNREVAQRLKAASLHRPAITRSQPHSRGR